VRESYWHGLIDVTGKKLFSFLDGHGNTQIQSSGVTFTMTVLTPQSDRKMCLDMTVKKGRVQYLPPVCVCNDQDGQVQQ